MTPWANQLKALKRLILFGEALIGVPMDDTFDAILLERLELLGEVLIDYLVDRDRVNALRQVVRRLREDRAALLMAQMMAQASQPESAHGDVP